MKNNPVLDAYVKRINRKLRTQEKQLKVALPSHRAQLGVYYIVSTAPDTYGSVLELSVSIEAVGTNLGMQSPYTNADKSATFGS